MSFAKSSTEKSSTRFGLLDGPRTRFLLLFGGTSAATAISWLFHLYQPPVQSGAIELLRLTSAAFLIGVAPGLLIFFLCRPLKAYSLEILAFSIGLSLALVQLVTVISLLSHTPFSYLALGYMVVLPLLAGSLLFIPAVQSPPTLIRPTSSFEGASVVAALLFLAIAFYIRGNIPLLMFAYENRIHLGVITQLAESSSPSITNIFFIPDVPFTYPFAGIHGFYALLNLVSGLPAIAVFDKMRGLWAVASLSLVFGLASAILGSRPLARAAFWSAWALVLSGAYGWVPGFEWSQLAPSSHTSDIAMNIALPATMIFLFRLARARPGGKASAFFGISFLALCATLALVHPRELVQILVYSCCILLALFVFLGMGPRLRAVAIWISAALALAVAYRVWHAFSVPAITNLIASSNAAFFQYVESLSWSELLFEPLSPFYQGKIETFLHGAGAAMLLALVIGMFLFGRRVSVWAIGLSSLMYLLMIRFTVLSIPYIFLTNDEMLLTPVRNTIHFEYVFLGAVLGWLAYQLRDTSGARAFHTRAAIALATGLALGGLSWICNRSLADTPALSTLTEIALLLAIAGLATAMLFQVKAIMRPRGMVSTRNFVSNLPVRSGLPMFMLLLVPVAIGSAIGISSPLYPLKGRVALTESQYYSLNKLIWLGETPQNVSCLSLNPRDEFLPRLASTPLPMCIPDYEVIEFINNRLPSDAVLLLNPANFMFAGIPYIRRKFAAPLGSVSFRDPISLFPGFYESLQSALATTRSQPFFNDLPVVAEQDHAFARKIKATHVLIDPMFAANLVPALRARPDLFAPLFTSNGWTLFEVK